MDIKELLARALEAHDDIKAILTGLENVPPIYMDTDSCLMPVKGPRTGRETIQSLNRQGHRISTSGEQGLNTARRMPRNTEVIE